MEQHILTSLVTLLIVAALGRPLVAAVLHPTPGGAVLLTSVLYLVGATIVEWRVGTETAGMVFAVCALLFSVYALAFVGVSAAFGLRVRPRQSAYEASANYVGASAAKWVFLLLTLGAVGLAVYATGTNKLLSTLFQFVVLGDTEMSVLELRLGFASGEDRWLAPGYVKQLRDVLMPLGGLLVLFTVRRSPGRFLAIAAVTIPLVAVLMISSGERGPVLLFLIGATYAARQSVRNGLQAARVVFIPVVMVVAVGGGAFYALTSSFTSRQYDDMPLALVLADRVVTRAPEENVNGAPVWSRGASFAGAGWLSEIASVLPGTQVTLSNLIHEELGGSDKGNSVLGMWVDVFYNFGWLFGVPVAATLGVLMALFNHWVNVRRSRSPTADICGLWIAVTMLMVLSPFGFLLYGPFVLSACLLFTGRQKTIGLLVPATRQLAC